MVKCIRDWCGHQEITGRPFWLPFFRPGQPKRDEPHCTDCAKKVRGPQIEATLRDARTLMNTFGGIVDLADLGRVEMVDGKPVVHGRLGAPIVLFKQGQIFPAQGAASTLLAEEQYRIGRRMVEAIDRLFPHARYRERHRITERLAYVKERLVECEAHRQVVEEHRQSQQMIPSDARRAFRRLASEVFIDAKGMLDDIGESFRKEERAAHVSKEDGLLIEAVKGFNPAALVSKEEEESVGEEVPPETPSEGVAEAPAEVPAAEAPPAGEEEPVTAPSGEAAEVEAEGPAEEAPEPEVEGEEEAVSGPEVQEPAQAKARKQARRRRSTSEGGRKPPRRNGPPPKRKDIEVQLGAAGEDNADPPDASCSGSVLAATPGDSGAPPDPDSPFAVLAEARDNGTLKLAD